MKKFYLINLLLFLSWGYFGQKVYKTPSGKAYHLSSCRMVENVSKELLGKDAIIKHKLNPCKICKPPVQNFTISNSNNKAVGKTNKSLQCKGITQKGNRCKHKTKLANGYCYQHEPNK